MSAYVDHLREMFKTDAYRSIFNWAHSEKFSEEVLEVNAIPLELTVGER